MSYYIQGPCINCGRCASVCPAGAIASDGLQYRIDPKKCRSCGQRNPAPKCRKLSGRSCICGRHPGRAGRENGCSRRCLRFLRCPLQRAV
ncbi:MAG: 4Fe-4S binding protein [Oscillospiraceae bacterium]|nr:4Fe-4S binding protein [Oscillospiraceae bacterium]